MAIKTIQTYQFQNKSIAGVKPLFELTAMQLDTYCEATKNEVSTCYRIYWIEDGNGTYQIDFKEFKIKSSGIFCLSPGQVFTVKSEKVKSIFSDFL